MNDERDLQAEFETQGVRYSHKHDAYYKAATGEWIEKTCGDSNCEFCKDRPERAFET